MRALMSLMLLAACAPTVEEADPPLEQTDADIDSDSDDRSVEDPYDHVRCDGSYMPDVPDAPSALSLSPRDTPLHEAGWSPDLAAHLLDPTTEAFDPVSALPAELLDLIDDAVWPSISEVPANVTDLTGAMRVETRWSSDAPWTSEKAIRLDAEGRLVAEYDTSGGTVWSARFFAYDGPVTTQREVFLRGDYIAANSQHLTAEQDGYRYERTDQYPEGRDRWAGPWRSVREVIHVPVVDAPSNLAAASLSLRHQPDYEEIGGRWLRWAPGHESWRFDKDHPVRIGALATANNNRISSPYRPVLLMDGGRTSIEYRQDHRQITITCPSERPELGDDQLHVWTEPSSDVPNIITRRHWTGPHSYEDSRDADGDGTWDSGASVERDGLLETVVSWQLVNGERVQTSTLERVLSEGGVVIEERADRGRGVYELRLRPVE